MQVRFGAIITDGFGKVGGHTIRRFRGTRSMYKTTIPTKTNSFQTNSANQINRGVLQAWTGTQVNFHREWSEQAKLYPFPDKWGNAKFLSGREFFTKIAITCAFAGKNLPNPGLPLGSTPSLSLDDVTLNVTLGSLSLTNLQVSLDGRVLIHVRRLKNSSVNPDPSRIKFCCFAESVGLDSSQYYDIVSSAFGGFKVGSFYQFTFYGVSATGLKSGLESFIVQAV